MIRLILLALSMILIGIVSLIAYPVSLLIGLFDKKKRESYSLAFVKISLRILLFVCGAKIRYIGLENLPSKGEAVCYVGNHRSFFDVMATYPVVPGTTGFVAKKEMASWPVISWWMKNIHCLFLDRKNPYAGVKTIVQGIGYIKNGTSMVIYPEGTRSKTEGHVGTFHGGSFKLATKSGAKIIPVVYNNSAAIWEDHFPWIRSAEMTVEFCEPIDTADAKTAEVSVLADKVRDVIVSTHLKNMQTKN